MPTLNWIGKDKVINHHHDVPFRVLNHKYSHGENVAGNMIIHGDNLDALKALLPKYEGRIKCVYIDPPYNTGNEGWVYNDNVNDPRIRKWLGEVVGREGEDLSRHDKWLCMMYPRLMLLQKLLADDGIMVLSISYHEVNNLILMCKEIFATKQITTVTVQTSGGKPSGGFNYVQEYLIYIAPKDFTPNPLTFAGGNARSPFEGLTLSTFDKTQRPNQAYPIFIDKNTHLITGVGLSLQQRIQNSEYTGELVDFTFDHAEAPEGSVALWPISSKGNDCVWRLISSRLLSDWEQGYIKVSPNTSSKNPNEFSVQYLPEGVIKKIKNGELPVVGNEDPAPTLIFGENTTVGSQIPTVWSEKQFFTVKGTALINEIFGEKKFEYSKPVDLIEEVIRSITDDGDLILDSFAGSGTTAHAVLNLNAQDGGNRKFICIEMMDYAETITAERVRRVVDGYADKPGTGSGFNYYELGEPLLLPDGNLNENISDQKIYEYIWFTETKTAYTPHDGYHLGTQSDTAYFFYYLRDSLTVLDAEFLQTHIAQDKEQPSQRYVIYADMCAFDQTDLERFNIVFKKIPRDISRL